MIVSRKCPTPARSSWAPAYSFPTSTSTATPWTTITQRLQENHRRQGHDRAEQPFHEFAGLPGAIRFREAIATEACRRLFQGGERNRITWPRCSAAAANLVLLDEPTNDLDVNTMRVLEQAAGLSGCAAVISHDRFFLDRICTHLLIMEGDGQTRWYGQFHGLREVGDGREPRAAWPTGAAPSTIGWRHEVGRHAAGCQPASAHNSPLTAELAIIKQIASAISSGDESAAPTACGAGRSRESSRRPSCAPSAYP